MRATCGILIFCTLTAAGVGEAAGRPPAAAGVRLAASTDQAASTDLAALEVVASDLGPVFRGASVRAGAENGTGRPRLPGAVLGVDGAYSVPVAPGRSLWIFGDTVLGTWTADGSRSLEAMPANSAALVYDADWRTGFRGARWVQAAPILDSPEPKRRRWPLDALRVGGAVWLYFVEIAPTGGSGLFDFEVTASGVARLGGDYRAVEVRPLWDGKAPTYGTSVVQRRGDAFVFAGGAATYLARVAPGRLGTASAYSYLAADGKWASDPGQAAALPESGAEMTVRWNSYLQAFLMVYIPPLGREIRMRTAPEPWGPWTEPRTVAPCQPAGDPDASCYGAKQHVELDREGGREVFLTYNTNVAPAKLAGRPDLYWPRLVKVKLGKGPAL